MSSPVTVCHQEFDESHFLASEYEPARPEQAAFHIIPVPLEQSVSYGGGTAHGPAAILSASQQLEAWDGISAPGEAGLYTAPAVDCDAPIETVLDRIEAVTAHALRCKALPVILGGEHTVSLGALRALAAEAARTGEPFGVVQFDAHADLRSQYEGSIYSHASVMHRPWPTLACRWPSSPCATSAAKKWRCAASTMSCTMTPTSSSARACRNSPCPRTFPAASTSPSTWTVWMPR